MGTILIIEDDISNAQLMQAAVESFGYQTVITHLGKEGLELAEQYQPDLVLLDMRLPGAYSGWDFIDDVRHHDQLSQMPIIVVSVTVSAADKEQAIQLGCNEYLSKPFKVQTLRQIIAQYLVIES